MRYCGNCGTAWSDDLVKKWGQTKETSGYGARPVCTAIVTDPQTKAGAVCRGDLAFVVDGSDTAVELLSAREADGMTLRLASGAELPRFSPGDKIVEDDNGVRQVTLL